MRGLGRNQKDIKFFVLQVRLILNSFAHKPTNQIVCLLLKVKNKLPFYFILCREVSSFGCFCIFDHRYELENNMFCIECNSQSTHLRWLSRFCAHERFRKESKKHFKFFVLHARLILNSFAHKPTSYHFILFFVEKLSNFICFYIFDYRYEFKKSIICTEGIKRSTHLCWLLHVLCPWEAMLPLCSTQVWHHVSGLPSDITRSL